MGLQTEQAIRDRAERSHKAITELLEARRRLLAEDWEAVEERLSPLLDSMIVAWGMIDDPSDIYMTHPYARVMAATKSHVEGFAERAESEADEVSRSVLRQGWRLGAELLGVYGAVSLTETTLIPRVKPMRQATTIALTALVSAIEDGPADFAENARNGMRHALSFVQVRTHDQIVQSFQEGMASAYEQAAGFYYQRFSAFSPTTCIACILLHGRVYRSPRDFSDHPNGFCLLVPIPEGQPLLIPQNEGLQWFLGLSPAEQRQILGDEYYAAWIEGRFELIELVKFTAAGYAVVRPLQELFDDDEGR